eukprot:10300815-Alexandrium_andersonii.AAC.1
MADSTDPSTEAHWPPSELPPNRSLLWMKMLLHSISTDRVVLSGSSDTEYGAHLGATGPH